MNQTRVVLKRILMSTSVLALLVAVVGGIVGLLVAGPSGLISALIGAAMALVFSAVTVVSVRIASQRDPLFFFPIVMGAWLLKAVVFLAVIWVLQGRAFVNGPVLFFTLVAVVVGSLVIDVVVVAKSRTPYASDVQLPGDEDYHAPGE